MQEIDLSRLEMMLGKEAVVKLKKTHFCIIGLGGVGGYAAEAIARFGVGKITLIDGDIVDRSNLNRQLCALNSTIGKDKVAVIKARILDINPDCKVFAKKHFIKQDEDFGSLFEDKPDFVIEAIDTVASKIALLSYLVANGFKIISSMGAGLRFDPAKIKIAPLKKTSECPLAAKIRKTFNKNKVALDFLCVYSTEKPKENIDLGLVKNDLGKTPLGSVATIPAIFGLFLANEAIKNLVEAWHHE